MSHMTVSGLDTELFKSLVYVPPPRRIAIREWFHNAPDEMIFSLVRRSHSIFSYTSDSYERWVVKRDMSQANAVQKRAREHYCQYPIQQAVLEIKDRFDSLPSEVFPGKTLSYRLVRTRVRYLLEYREESFEEELRLHGVQEETILILVRFREFILKNGFNH